MTSVTAAAVKGSPGTGQSGRKLNRVTAPDRGLLPAIHPALQDQGFSRTGDPNHPVYLWGGCRAPRPEVFHCEAQKSSAGWGGACWGSWPGRASTPTGKSEHSAQLNQECEAFGVSC